MTHTSSVPWAPQEPETLTAKYVTARENLRFVRDELEREFELGDQADLDLVTLLFDQLLDCRRTFSELDAVVRDALWAEEVDELHKQIRTVEARLQGDEMSAPRSGLTRRLSRDQRCPAGGRKDEHGHDD